MINKELIKRFRDMADLADASYAFLEYVYENEVKGWLDDIKTPPLWFYADDIGLGYEITDKNKTKLSKQNNRQIGEPTAYAMAIEARFCQDLMMDKPTINEKTQKMEYKPTKIDNKIQNFIYRENSDKKAEKQAVILAKTPEEQLKNPNKFTHHLSLRTKNFVNRFELVHHIPNTTISGFSATLFYDTENKEYILSFRGTEMIDPRDIITDIFVATYPPIAIDQAIALSMLAKRILRVVIAHQERLASENADTYLYIHDLDSQKQAYKSFQSLANYFMQNNIKFIITGHSLGGHLAQLFCVGYPLLAKEIYTYNAPGIGGIITTAMILFLRVLRIIWKLLVVLVKSVAKLFNPNGFTRKVLDKSLQASGYEGESENLIRVMEANKGHTIFGELGLNAKKVKRGENLGIEIHHIESIRAAMRNDESTQATWQQLWEPTSSIVSDLGIKLGLNIDDKLDYKNTEALHLINVAKHSHFMIDTAQTLYFYTYLLSYKANAEKYQDYTIAQMLDSLNVFIQSLAFQNEFYKLYRRENTYHFAFFDRTKSEFNASLAMLDSPLYPICAHTHTLLAQTKHKKLPLIQNLIDCLLFYKESKIYAKIIDKNDIDTTMMKLDTTSSIAKLYALYQCHFFILTNENDREILYNAHSHNPHSNVNTHIQADIVKLLGYNSNFVKHICLEQNADNYKDYIEARKQVYKSAYNLCYEKWHYPYKKACDKAIIQEDTNSPFLIFSKFGLLKNVKEAIIIKKASHQKSIDSKEQVQNTKDIFKLELDEILYKNDNTIIIFAKDGTMLNAKENETILGLVSTDSPAQIYFGNLKVEGGEEDRENAGWFYGKNEEYYNIDSMGNLSIYYKNMSMQLNHCYYEAYNS